jgi:hypothetical protein
MQHGKVNYIYTLQARSCHGRKLCLTNRIKRTTMKKIIAAGAILASLSAQVLAQDNAAPAASNSGNAAATAQTGTASTGAAGAGSSGGFLGGGTIAGVSTATAVAIGATIAFVAAASSDDGSATSHSTTTHH